MTHDAHPSATERWQPHPQAVVQRLGDSMVLVHMETDRIFELNLTATRLWELLNEGHGRSAIEARLLDEFNVDESVLKDEIDATLDMFVDERMIVADER